MPILLTWILQLAERVAKLANKTHKDRVNEFNAHLESLSEHHDIPKVCRVSHYPSRLSRPIMVGRPRIRRRLLTMLGLGLYTPNETALPFFPLISLLMQSIILLSLQLVVIHVQRA